mmetsp:Transcript_7837/g.16106  ORF Transcript_7837/g.16106 Transcript_7837/m.16106 type:complete len:354 (+) Transcript_7837:118-1179(+)
MASKGVSSTFVHKINWSSLTEKFDERKTLPSEQACGFKWQVEIFPSGGKYTNEKQGDDFLKKHVAIFFRKMSGDPVKAQVEFSIINQNEGKPDKKLPKFDQKFASEGWGFNKELRQDDLTEAKGFKVNDHVMIRVDFTCQIAAGLHEEVKKKADEETARADKVIRVAEEEAKKEKAKKEAEEARKTMYLKALASKQADFDAMHRSLEDLMVAATAKHDNLLKVHSARQSEVKNISQIKNEQLGKISVLNKSIAGLATKDSKNEAIDAESQKTIDSLSAKITASKQTAAEDYAALDELEEQCRDVSNLLQESEVALAETQEVERKSSREFTAFEKATKRKVAAAATRGKGKFGS